MFDRIWMERVLVSTWSGDIRWISAISPASNRSSRYHAEGLFIYGKEEEGRRVFISGKGGKNQ